MKKNCRWSLGLLLSALVLLVGCQDKDCPSGALQLSKETVTIAVGQEITLTRAGKGGAVEVILPSGEDFALTVDNEQVAQVQGKTIKGVAPGKAIVTVTAGAQRALLTVEVQAANKNQKVGNPLTHMDQCASRSYHRLRCSGGCWGRCSRHDNTCC